MLKLQKIVLITASGLGALSVIIGAFGAHKFKDFLNETGRLETFETAVKYQFYHVFALALVGLLMYKLDNKYLGYSAYAFIIGILIFSGSLYTLCATQIKVLGAITPFGGVFLIVGWALLALAIYKA